MALKLIRPAVIIEFSPSLAYVHCIISEVRRRQDKTTSAVLCSSRRIFFHPVPPADRGVCRLQRARPPTPSMYSVLSGPPNSPFRFSVPIWEWRQEYLTACLKDTSHRRYIKLFPLALLLSVILIYFHYLRELYNSRYFRTISPFFASCLCIFFPSSCLIYWDYLLGLNMLLEDHYQSLLLSYYHLYLLILLY